MKKIKINSLISVTLLVVQAYLGYNAFINQREGMEGSTRGVSLAMFAAIFIFSSTNSVLCILSWWNKKTFAAFLKIIPYTVVAIAYVLMTYDCINSRLSHNVSWWHKDDLLALIFLVGGYGIFVFFEIFKGLSFKNIFSNPINWGYFGGFTILVAHLILGFHMMISKSSAGVATEFIALTLVSASVRLLQNIFDILLAGIDSEKKAVLGSELWNVFTWIIVCIIFFILHSLSL